MPERTGTPHFTHRAANLLNKAHVPHERQTDDVIGLWLQGQSSGLVTVYRRGIACKLTAILHLSEDGKTVLDVELLE